jgi:hypothetical protein
VDGDITCCALVVVVVVVVSLNTTLTTTLLLAVASYYYIPKYHVSINHYAKKLDSSKHILNHGHHARRAFDTK